MFHLLKSRPMRVGNRAVLTTISLIVPKGEDAWIEFPIQGWKLRLKLVFANDELSPGPRLQVETEDDHGRIVFTNWNNVLGTATKTPVQLATLNSGQRVVGMFWHAQVGEARKLDAELMLEAEP